MHDDDSVRVTVNMTRKQHKLLKQYAGCFGVSQSEIVTACLGYFGDKPRHVFTLTHMSFRNLTIDADRRRQRAGYGHQCHQCTKVVECRTGMYSGVLQVHENCRPLMTDEGKASMRAFQKAHDQAPQWMEDLNLNNSQS